MFDTTNYHIIDLAVVSNIVYIIFASLGKYSSIVINNNSNSFYLRI